MNLSKKEFISLAILIFLIITIPLIFLLIGRRISFFPKAAAFGKVVLSFEPSRHDGVIYPIPKKGEDFEVKMFLTKSTQDTQYDAYSVSGVNLLLDFNKNVLQLKQIRTTTDPSGQINDQNVFTDQLLSTEAVDPSSASYGRLVLIASSSASKLPIVRSTQGTSRAIELATLVFHAKEVGHSKLTVRKNDLGAVDIVADNGQNVDVNLQLVTVNEGDYVVANEQGETPTLPPTTITITGQPTTIITPTITPTPTCAPNTPQLSFKTAFKGIKDYKPDKISVGLRIVDESTPSANVWEAKDKIIVVPEDPNNSKNVIYQTSSPVCLNNLEAGIDYTILLKGEKHLRKRVVKRIPLVAGINEFDWSQILLEPGDLPNPNNNFKQDGVVNAVDHNLITQYSGKKDQEALRIGDLDYSGRVDGIDASLLLDTLSQKYDDED